MNFDIDPRDINLQGPDGMQLVKILRGLIAAIESGGDEPEPGDDSEFFYCTYGTTTYSEIQNALAEDKVPICIRNGLYYYLVNTTQNRYVFACYNPTNNYIYAVRCLTDRWDNVTFMLQERLTWDYTPTQGSTRPVTSGGVWTALQNAGGSDIDPYQQYPQMDGTPSPGSSDDYARGDHVHPTDTSRAAASEITRIDAALATKADQASIEQTIEDTVDDWLTAQAPSIGTLSYSAKRALLNLLQHVAYDHATDVQYYNALESELFPDATLESITAVFTQGSATIYDTDSLDTLRQYLVVTATYSDSTTETVTDYTLTGTLTAGTSTITVSYGGKTDTFTVTVSMGYRFPGAITKLVGGLNAKPNVGHGMTYTSNGIYRRSFFIPYGTSPQIYDETTGNYIDYYPMPIPSNATRITVTFAPSSQYFAVGLWNLSNGVYTRDVDSGWQTNGSYTATFNAGQYGFVAFSSKYNSAGTSYPTEPTGITVTFE